MKKIIILIIFIIISYALISFYITNNTIIPNESIRIRVLSNSNSDIDQNIKKQISKNIMIYLNKELKDINSIKEARTKIINSINDINKIIDKTLKENNINQDYKTTYGYNYFPEKEFLNKKYKEGFYESLLITLGTGLGNNFWCLLFPPLCMLDNEEMEYTSLINELLNV